MYDVKMFRQRTIQYAKKCRTKEISFHFLNFRFKFQVMHFSNLIFSLHYAHQICIKSHFFDGKTCFLLMSEYFIEIHSINSLYSSVVVFFTSASWTYKYILKKYISQRSCVCLYKGYKKTKPNVSFLCFSIIYNHSAEEMRFNHLTVSLSL